MVHLFTAFATAFLVSSCGTEPKPTPESGDRLFGVSSRANPIYYPPYAGVLRRAFVGLRNKAFAARQRIVPVDGAQAIKTYLRWNYGTNTTGSDALAAEWLSLTDKVTPCTPLNKRIRMKFAEDIQCEEQISSKLGNEALFEKIYSLWMIEKYASGLVAHFKTWNLKKFGREQQWNLERKKQVLSLVGKANYLETFARSQLHLMEQMGMLYEETLESWSRTRKLNKGHITAAKSETLIVQAKTALTHEVVLVAVEIQNLYREVLANGRACSSSGDCEPTNCKDNDCDEPVSCDPRGICSNDQNFGFIAEVLDPVETIMGPLNKKWTDFRDCQPDYKQDWINDQNRKKLWPSKAACVPDNS